MKLIVYIFTTDVLFASMLGFIKIISNSDGW